MATVQHLARSKLSAPLTTPFRIVRRHISDRIIASDSARLVLVRGPAGFGKTTVMMQLREMAEQDGARCAWLNLDEADNDASRFLLYLSQALNTLADGAADGTPDRDTPALDHADDLALELIDRIAAEPGPFALFLDDFEVIRNPSVLGLVTQLVESLPPNGRVIIGSRIAPEIGLGRLRAKGYLTEIDPSHLRFTLEEARDFLRQQRKLVLSADQLRQLHKDTEGWVTAIWLASIALERRSDIDAFIGSFSGSNAAIADYLAEDVLAGLADEVREFLLCTSILEELTVPLCNAVSQRNDSAEILRQLERANLFLVPRNEDRSIYRFHSLFLSFLRNQLSQKPPDMAAKLHRRAAEAYLLQDRAIPAIHHAIACGDMGFALPLLTQNVERLLIEGRLRLLLSWFEALSPATLDEQPMLRLSYAWAVCFTRGAAEALRLVESLNADELPPEPQANLRALRPLGMGMVDRLDEGYELGMDALGQVGAEHHFAHSMLAQALSNICMVTGRFAEAHRFNQRARKSQGDADRVPGRFTLVLADAAEATMELMQGRLRQATARLQTADPSWQGDSEAPLRSRNAFQGVLLAEVLYDAGRLDEARRLLEVYVPLARSLALPDKLISAYVLLSRILLRTGDDDRWLQLLTELEAIGHRMALPRVVASARLERAHQWLLQGDLSRAKEQLKGAADAKLWARVSRQWFIANDTLTYSLASWRFQIHTGHAEKTLQPLKEELESAELGQRHRRALKIRILLADALHRDGQHKRALRVLTRALEFASSEGFTQTFLEEGSTIEKLLRECAAARQTDSEPGSQAASSLLNSLTRSEPGSRKLESAVSSDGLNALTHKEIEVLDLVALGHTNDQIAGKLFISETTVRTHLRSVNLKFHTSSRTQAVATARRLGFIR